MLQLTWKAADLELHMGSVAFALESGHRCCSIPGEVRGPALGALVPGGSVPVVAPANGFADEVFLDAQGRFTLETEVPGSGAASLLLTVYDPHGREVAGATLAIGPADTAAPAESLAPVNVVHDLEPAWPRFARRVRECLILAGKLAEVSGRPPEEIFEQVYAQERYAERAFAAKDQALYRECFDNLGELVRYLEQLCRAYLPP